MRLELSPPTTTGAIRMPDAMGDGAFAASRGDRLHAGVDFIADPGEVIMSPCDGIITRIGYCYADDPSYRLIEITDDPIVVRVLYVSPCVKVGQAVGIGTPIGVAQDVAARYGGGMQNHVHLDARLERGVLIGRGNRPPDRVYIDPTFLI